MLAHHWGLAFESGGEPNFSIKIGQPRPCLASGLSAQGGVVSGCRVGGCAISAKYRGDSLRAIELWIPANPYDETTKNVLRTQAACIVAATAASSGLWGAWTTMSDESVILVDQGADAPPSYRVDKNSPLWNCNYSTQGR